MNILKFSVVLTTDTNLLKPNQFWTRFQVN